MDYILAVGAMAVEELTEAGYTPLPYSALTESDRIIDRYVTDSSEDVSRARLFPYSKRAEYLIKRDAILNDE